MMSFWRLFRHAISMVSIVSILTGCGVPGAGPAGVAASSEERILSPDASRSDLGELSAGNNAFAFDLYQALRSGEDNLLYSPYSISQALAMVYAGARGETEQQMADTLHFALPQEQLHPAFNALDLELASRSHATSWDTSGEEVEEVAFELNIANAVWGQKGLSYLPEYLDLLAQNYGAGIRLVDFETDAAGAVNAINRWVSEETEGRIQNIVSGLSQDTGLVLANAVYFNAEWDLPFDEDDTYDQSFHLLDGGEVKVPMMHQQQYFRYTEGDGYQAIQLPYLNRDVAMVILLPRKGRFREIEAELTGEWVQPIVKELRRHEVILTMPKFGFETPKISLKQILSDMGMSNAFSRSADFFGIVKETPGLDIYISEVVHKAFIDVDEKRTEAAAVSIVVVVETIVELVDEPTEPPPIVMKIDRPFIFFIRDIRTDAILFVGRVMNPAGE